MKCLVRCSSKILFSALFVSFLVFVSHVAFADTTIDGYTFSVDSMNLYENSFFSEYDRTLDFLTSLIGYGDYTDYALSQTYHQEYTLDGIDCAVIREHVSIPPYGGLSPDVDVHDIYLYYAKDIDDNIHILLAAYSGDGGVIGWSYTDLPEGETTLKYPTDPVPGQEVFFGEVAETGKQVGDIEGCATIVFDSLPWTDGPITEYLRPGSGVFAMSHNWNDEINGYSYDGGAPEYAEEEKGTWEEWRDDHCFISACSR